MDFGFIKEEETFCREIDQFTTKELGDKEGKLWLGAIRTAGSNG